jgi:preprotein translocase subunit SecG
MVTLLDSKSFQRTLPFANTGLINRYTFWVAVLVLVLTIFFGLVQSIEGALQVYASFKGLDGST